MPELSIMLSVKRRIPEVLSERLRAEASRITSILDQSKQTVPGLTSVVFPEQPPDGHRFSTMSIQDRLKPGETIAI